MAFGKHWEWRGFGELSTALRARLEALPRKFPGSQEVTDSYLHVPGSPVNIKLRFADLKFKRLLEKTAGVELWLEDPTENHGFPIRPEVLATLGKDLGVTFREACNAPVDLPGLLARLQAATPSVELVAVKKTRWQHEWPCVDPAGAVTIELAQIHSPQAIWSVGIEHPCQEPVLAALKQLKIQSELRQLNYLEALSIWADGGVILGE